MEIFNRLVDYLQYDFVVYAFIVAVLIALCSSLLGVTLVLKRFSFIGDGLSHVAFGAMSFALILKLTNNMFFILPITAICAVLLLKSGNNTKIKGDSAIAMISTGALALGYLVMNVFPVSKNVSTDVCTTLFGATSILTLSNTDVIICLVLSVLIVILYILNYNKIFSVTFDEDFSKASGINVKGYNLLVALCTAVIIVLAMNLVGSLLISALIVFPAVSSMQVFNSFKQVVISSSILSVICATIGIFIAIIFGTPVGSTIVLANMLAFCVYYILGKLRLG